MFRSDALLHLPGEGYSYTTHGFTLISAVIESIAATSFPFEKPARLGEKPVKEATESDPKELPARAKYQNILKDLFNFLGLKNTCLDYNDRIVPFRAKFVFFCCVNDFLFA